jgi:hypothetical protein
MKQRRRYVLLWHSLPGTVAAYQPVRAPDPLSARLNVGNMFATPKRYAATLGVAPTWGPRTGWTFATNGQYFKTGVIPYNGFSALVKYSTATLTGYHIILGTFTSGQPKRFFIFLTDNGIQEFGYGSAYPINVGTPTVEGVLGITGYGAYFDGKLLTTLPHTWLDVQQLYIGAGNYYDSTPFYSYIGAMQSVSVYDRTLTASEVALCSLQMKYCGVCNDFNAWGRQRNWYFAPMTATGRSWPVIGRGMIDGKPGGGIIGGRP